MYPPSVCLYAQVNHPRVKFASLVEATMFRSFKSNLVRLQASPETRRATSPAGMSSCSRRWCGSAYRSRSRCTSQSGCCCRSWWFWRFLWTRDEEISLSGGSHSVIMCALRSRRYMRLSCVSKTSVHNIQNLHSSAVGQEIDAAEQSIMGSHWSPLGLHSAAQAHLSAFFGTVWAFREKKIHPSLYWFKYKSKIITHIFPAND